MTTPLHRVCPNCHARQIILADVTPAEKIQTEESQPVRCVKCGATFLVYVPASKRIEGPFSV